MNNVHVRGVIAALLAVMIFPLYAGEGKANFSMVSDYIFRGATASNNKFVVQGGYEYDYGNSLVSGAWISSLPGAYEYDIYARFDDSVDDFGYSAGIIYYGYTKLTPSSSEVNLAVSYKDFSIMSSTGENLVYNEATYDTTLSDIAIRLHYGHDGQDPDYSLRISKRMSGFDIGLVYASKLDTLTSISTDVYAFTIGKDF
ncbi:MAG: hypothetical protein OEX03_01515 [Gammaproteobacteria bacterium]|nr:hypothetical protein [Gammaproteobacteria bacterium]